MTTKQFAGASSSSFSSGLVWKNDEMNSPLKLFGFKYDVVSPSLVRGHLPITAECCHASEDNNNNNNNSRKELHGGILAMIAEAIASLGAIVSSQKRAAGVHLSIHHFAKDVNIGDLIVAEAKPLNVIPQLQVWEVRFWKSANNSTCSSASGDLSLLSSSRVTCYCNVSSSITAKQAVDTLFLNAKI